MDATLFKQAAWAIGGRLRSALGQFAKDEASRAIRHFRERMRGPRPGRAAHPAPLASPPTLERPTVAEAAAPAQARREPGPATSEAPERDGLLDVNTASKDELMSLKGVGAARAEAIVKGRPFGRPAELVERRILPAAVYTAIAERIRAGRPQRSQERDG